jgi:hypothetical protein
VANGPVLTEFSKKDFTLRKDARGQLSVVPINEAPQEK